MCGVGSRDLTFLVLFVFLRSSVRPRQSQRWGLRPLSSLPLTFCLLELILLLWEIVSTRTDGPDTFGVHLPIPSPGVLGSGRKRTRTFKFGMRRKSKHSSGILYVNDVFLMHEEVFLRVRKEVSLPTAPYRCKKILSWIIWVFGPTPSLVSES